MSSATQPSEEGKDTQVDTMFPRIPPPYSPILSSPNNKQTSTSREQEIVFINKPAIYKMSSDGLRQKQTLKATVTGQGKRGKRASSSINQRLENREVLKRIPEM